MDPEVIVIPPTGDAKTTQLRQNRSATVSGYPTNGQILSRPHVSPNLRTKKQHSIQGYSSATENKSEFAKCVVAQKYQSSLKTQIPPKPQPPTPHFELRPIHSKLSSSQPYLNTDDIVRRRSYTQGEVTSRSTPGGYNRKNRFSFAGIGSNDGKNKPHIFFPNSYNVTLTKLSLEDLRPQPIAVPIPTVPRPAQRFSSSYTEDDDIDAPVSLRQPLSADHFEKSVLNSSKPAKSTFSDVPNKSKLLQSATTVKVGQSMTNLTSAGAVANPVPQGNQLVHNHSLQKDVSQRIHVNGIQTTYTSNQQNGPQGAQHVYPTSGNTTQNEHSIDHTNGAHCTAVHKKDLNVLWSTPTPSLQNQHHTVNNNKTVSQQITQSSHPAHYSIKVEDIDSGAVNGSAFDQNYSPMEQGSFSWPTSPCDFYETNYLFHQQSLSSGTSQVNPAGDYNSGQHIQYPSYPSVKLSNSNGLAYSSQSVHVSVGDLTHSSITGLSMSAADSPSSTSSCSTCQTRTPSTLDQFDDKQNKGAESPISASISISPFSPTSVSHNETSFSRATQSEGILDHKQSEKKVVPQTSSLQYCGTTHDDFYHEYNGASVHEKISSPGLAEHKKYSTLPVSYRKPQRSDRSISHMMRRSSSLRDILEVDETEHEVARAEIKLSDYIDLNVSRLPQKVKICKGFCSYSGEVTLSRGEVFDIHFVKHTKVITMYDAQGTSYCVPLNSTIKFAIVYNPFNVKTVGATHTLGFQFKSAGEIMSLKHLPTVISVTKHYKGGSQESSVLEGEVLVVQGVKKTDNGNLLKVVSRDEGKTKFLSEDCTAHFTTSTLRTQLTVDEMFQLLVPLPQKAMLFFPAGMLDNFPSHIFTTAVTLNHFNVIKSVIATPAVLYNKAKLPQSIEIEVELDTEVQEVVDLPESKYSEMVSVSQAVYNSFDPSKVQLYKDTLNSQAHQVQLTFWTSLEKNQTLHGVHLEISQEISRFTKNQEHGDKVMPSIPCDKCSKQQNSFSPSMPATKFELEIRLRAVELRSQRVDEEVGKLSRKLSDVSHQITQLQSLLTGHSKQVTDSTIPNNSSTCAKISQKMQPQNKHDLESPLKIGSESHTVQSLLTGHSKHVTDSTIPNNSSTCDKISQKMQPQNKHDWESPHVHVGSESHTVHSKLTSDQQPNAVNPPASYPNTQSSPTKSVKSKNQIDNRDNLSSSDRYKTKPAKSQTVEHQHSSYHRQTINGIENLKQTTTFDNEQQHLKYSTKGQSKLQLPNHHHATASPKHNQKPSVRPPTAPKPQRCGSGKRREQGIDQSSSGSPQRQLANVSPRHGNKEEEVEHKGVVHYMSNHQAEKTADPLANGLQALNNAKTLLNEKEHITHYAQPEQQIFAEVDVHESTMAYVESAECEIDAIVNDLTLFCSKIEDEISKYSSSIETEGLTLV